MTTASSLKSSLSKLPYELYPKIFLHMTDSDLALLARVNREFAAVIRKMFGDFYIAHTTPEIERLVQRLTPLFYRPNLRERPSHKIKMLIELYLSAHPTAKPQKISLPQILAAAQHTEKVNEQSLITFTNEEFSTAFTNPIETRQWWSETFPTFCKHRDEQNSLSWSSTFQKALHNGLLEIAQNLLSLINPEQLAAHIRAAFTFNRVASTRWRTLMSVLLTTPRFADIPARGDYGLGDILAVATLNGCLNIANLIDSPRFAEISFDDWYSLGTALLLAVEGGHLNMVNALIHSRRLNDLLIIEKHNLADALLWAARSGNLNIINALIHSRCFANIPPNDVISALKEALQIIRKNRSDIVRAIVYSDLFTCIPFNKEHPVLRELYDWAVCYDHSDVVDRFDLSSDCRTPDQSTINRTISPTPASGYRFKHALLKAAQFGHLTKFKELSRTSCFAEVPPDGEYGLGHALREAARWNRLHVVIALSKTPRFAEVPPDGEYGLTASIFIANEKIRVILIAAIAQNPDSIYNLRYTLWKASSEDRLDIINALGWYHQVTEIPFNGELGLNACIQIAASDRLRTALTTVRAQRILNQENLPKNRLLQSCVIL